GGGEEGGRGGGGGGGGGRVCRRPAKTDAGHADLRAVPLQVLDTAAHVLTRRVGEVEVRHQVLGLFRLDCDLSAVEIRHQRPVTSAGHAVGDSPDLGVQPPPLLDHHHAWPAASRGLREVSLHALSIRPLEADCLTHVSPPLKSILYAAAMSTAGPMTPSPIAKPSRSRSKARESRRVRRVPAYCVGSPRCSR